MNQPLGNITVLDLGQIYNGPYCGYLMAMAGADVIKVESPVGEGLRGRAETSSATYAFHLLNANKRGVTLNLKDARGRELLGRLASAADVLIENFAPGTMTRLGVGPDALTAINPRLIYAAGTGFGATGPHKDYRAMDITIQALSGMMSITGTGGGPPLKTGAAICDFLGGVHLYAAISTALYERERTGLGRVVDLSMQDAVLPTLATAMGALHHLGHVPPRAGNHHPALALAPYNVYRARDGHVAIICIRQGHWRHLVDAMGQPELLDEPRFATMEARARNMAAVDEAVETWTSSLTRDEIFRIAQAHDVICAPVNDLEDVADDPHLHARGSWRAVDEAPLGAAVMPSTPLRFAGLEPPPRSPPPRLGEHNAEVYGSLGLGEAELVALRADGVI